MQERHPAQFRQCPGDHVVLADALRLLRDDGAVVYINGQEVLRYQKPQLDPACRIVSAEPLVKARAPVMLGSGHLALQAEGQGVWFRDIELKSMEAE